MPSEPSSFTITDCEIVAMYDCIKQVPVADRPLPNTISLELARELNKHFIALNLTSPFLTDKTVQVDTTDKTGNVDIGKIAVKLALNRAVDFLNKKRRPDLKELILENNTPSYKKNSSGGHESTSVLRIVVSESVDTRWTKTIEWASDSPFDVHCAVALRVRLLQKHD